MARPKAPESSHTSTSTVGLPRESRISRALTVRISDTSGLSLDDEGSQGAQGQGALAEGRKGGVGVGDERLRASARGLDTVHGGIGRLLLRLVLARRLAQLLRRRRDIEDVVHDLEGEAEAVAGDAERLELGRAGPGEDRPRPDRGADEGGRLVGVDVVHDGHPGYLALALDVGDLASPLPAVPAASATSTSTSRSRPASPRAGEQLARSRKARVRSASPARMAMASPNTLWLVGTPRRKSSLSMAGRSS